MLREMLPGIIIVKELMQLNYNWYFDKTRLSAQITVGLVNKIKYSPLIKKEYTQLNLCNRFRERLHRFRRREIIMINEIFNLI